MTAAEITRAEALWALATAPFVLVILVAIALAVGYVAGRERAERPNPYTSPWRDREPGDLR